MAKEQSEASPYKSRFGNGWLTAAQYIAETMVARQARKRGQDLPPGYWKLPAWKRTFLLQILKANALLKLYDRRAIFAALRRAKFVLSLNNKMVLDPILQEEQDKLTFQERQKEERPEPAPVIQRPTEPAKPRPVYNPEQSLLAKLRSLDE